MTTTTSDNLVCVEIAIVKGVTVDQVKRVISVKLELPLNGDNFTASGKLAFWAFNEDTVKIDVSPRQQSFDLNMESSK